MASQTENETKKLTPEEVLNLFVKAHKSEDNRPNKGYSYDGISDASGFYMLSWDNPGNGTGASFEVNPSNGDVYKAGKITNNIFTTSNNDITPSEQPTAKKTLEENKSSQQINKFTDEELKKFKLIKKYYPDFNYSETYVYTSEYDKKMLFNKTNNLYFGTLISYDVIYYDGGVVNYYFDLGTAYRGCGSYYIIDDNTVIKIEKSSGKSAYTYEVYKNGKKIDSDTKEYRRDK